MFYIHWIYVFMFLLFMFFMCNLLLLYMHYVSVCVWHT